MIKIKRPMMTMFVVCRGVTYHYVPHLPSYFFSMSLISLQAALLISHTLA